MKKEELLRIIHRMKHKLFYRDESRRMRLAEHKAHIGRRKMHTKSYSELNELC